MLPNVPSLTSLPPRSATLIPPGIKQLGLNCHSRRASAEQVSYTSLGEIMTCRTSFK